MAQGCVCVVEHGRNLLAFERQSRANRIEARALGVVYTSERKNNSFRRSRLRRRRRQRQHNSIFHTDEMAGIRPTDAPDVPGPVRKPLFDRTKADKVAVWETPLSDGTPELVVP